MSVITSDPVQRMHVAVLSAGECVNVPNAPFSSRWRVKMPDAPEMHFGETVGNRLMLRGLIDRHPAEKTADPFAPIVRFVPIEKPVAPQEATKKNKGATCADIPKGRGQPQGGINAAVRDVEPSPEKKERRNKTTERVRLCRARKAAGLQAGQQAHVARGPTRPEASPWLPSVSPADREATKIALREFWRSMCNTGRVSLPKEVRERFHPETRHGGDRKSSCQLGDLNETERFTADTATTAQIVGEALFPPKKKAPTQQQTWGWEPIPEVEPLHATVEVCHGGNSYPHREDLCDLLARTVIFLLRVGSDWEHRSIEERAPYLIQAHSLQAMLVRANWNADKGGPQRGLRDSPWLGSIGEKASTPLPGSVGA